MTSAFLRQVLDAAQAAATAQQLPIAITIVDAGGHVRAVWRDAGCSYFALESSRQKAVTSSQLRLPSHVVGEIGQKFPALEASFQRNAEVTGLPGGFPLLAGGTVVGGVGVAGGDFVQDQTVAEAAAQAGVV